MCERNSGDVRPLGFTLKMTMFFRLSGIEAMPGYARERLRQQLRVVVVPSNASAHLRARRNRLLRARLPAACRRAFPDGRQRSTKSRADNDRSNRGAEPLLRQNCIESTFLVMSATRCRDRWPREHARTVEMHECPGMGAIADVIDERGRGTPCRRPY
jgi:hypothetical protein